MIFFLFTPPQNRGGGIFSFQFVCECVCLSVCLSVCLLVNKIPAECMYCTVPLTFSAPSDVNLDAEKINDYSCKC